MDPSLPPYFLLSKAKASCSLIPPPLQSQKNLQFDQSFSFDGTPYRPLELLEKYLWVFVTTLAQTDRFPA